MKIYFSAQPIEHEHTMLLELLILLLSIIDKRMLTTMLFMLITANVLLIIKDKHMNTSNCSIFCFLALTHFAKTKKMLLQKSLAKKLTLVLE